MRKNISKNQEYTSKVKLVSIVKNLISININLVSKKLLCLLEINAY
jgi:hypothetical protein